MPNSAEKAISVGVMQVSVDVSLLLLLALSIHPPVQ